MVETEPYDYTRAIAEYVTKTEYADLPSQSLEIAKVHLLDVFGIMLGAYATHHPLIRGLTELVSTESGRGDATLVGSGRRVGCADAALANAVMANFLDFSDGHFMGGHISDRIVPVALAAAERVGASGRDFLTAVVLGYEVYIELAYSFFEQVDSASIHLPLFVMLGTVAGVVPAAKLLHLSAAETAGAMGLAASLQIGSGQYVKSGGHEKDLAGGHEARRAMLSALLADKGILGSQDILEGERGVLAALGARPPHEAGIGTVPRITETYLKPYPACRYLHASIQATETLVREHGLAEDNVERATVTTNRSSAGRLSYVIKSHVHAIFSHAYQVASVLVDGKPSLPVAWKDKVADPRFVAALHKVAVKTDAKYEEMFLHRTVTRPPWPACVEVMLKNGRTYTAEVLCPKGDPLDPLTETEVKEKFNRLTQPVLAERRSSEIAYAVEHLENLPTTGELTGQLTVD